MSEKVKTHIIVLEPNSETVQELLKQVTQKGNAEVLAVKTVDEAAQSAYAYAPCMFLCSILDNAQIASVVNMLKKTEKLVKSGMLKTMIVSKVKNRQLSNLISSLGVTDYIEEPAPLRTMLFKSNLQIKALETVRKTEEQKKASQEKIVFKKSEQKKEEDAGGVTQNSKQKPALEIDEDTFLFKNSQAKKIGKKLVLEMEGPAPETGEWQKQPEDKGDAQNSWRWVPKEEKDQAKSEAEKNDGWVHTGEKPQFDAESGKWKLASEKPELALMKGGKKVAHKVSVDEKGELLIANDSPKAEENLRKNKQKAETARAKDSPDSVQKIGKSTTDAGEKNKEQEISSKSETKAAETKKQIKASTNPALEALAKLGKSKKPQDTAQPEEKIGKEKIASETENVVSLQDRRGTEKEKEVEFSDKRESGQTETPKKLSPLEFLQQKKKADKSEQSAKSESTSEKKEKEAEKTLKSNAPEKEKKGKVKSKSKDALEKLNQRLGSGTENLSPEAADDSSTEIEGAQNVDEEESQEQNFSKKESSISAEKTTKEKKRATESAETASPEKIQKTYAEQLEIKEKKKAIYKEIQEAMRKPLPETLTPEEEEKLRKELKLEGNPEISPKELAKRARVRAVKNLKNKLLQLDLKPDSKEETAAHVEHDLNPDESENTRSLKSFQKEDKGSRIRAFDSETEEAESEQADKKRARASEEEKSSSGKKNNADQFFYLPESAILPKGGAWELAGEYYVYLQAETRYRGFQKLTDLLPLWVFKGEKSPELMSKTKEWKFLGSKPTQTRAEADLPSDVRDYLLGLNKEKKESAPIAETEKAKTKADSKRDLRDLMAAAEKGTDRLEGPESQSDESADEDSDADEIEPAEAKATAPAKKEKRNLQDLLSAVEKNSDSILDSEESVEENSLKTEAPEIEATENEPKESQAESLKEIFEKKKAEDELAIESALAEKKKSKSTAQEEAESLTSSAAAFAPTLVSTPEVITERAARDPAKTNPEGIAEKVTSKLASESASIEKFLARRKNKERSATKIAQATNPFLAVYVCASDVLGQNLSKDKACLKLMGALESAFPHCIAVILEAEKNEGTARIRYCIDDALRAEGKLAIDAPLSFPITKDGSEADNLGYLILRAKAPRVEFNEAEVVAAKKCATFFWALLNKPETVQEEQAA
jgi:hypothetical protein